MAGRGQALCVNLQEETQGAGDQSTGQKPAQDVETDAGRPAFADGRQHQAGDAGGHQLDGRQRQGRDIAHQTRIEVEDQGKQAGSPEDEPLCRFDMKAFRSAGLSHAQQSETEQGGGQGDPGAHRRPVLEQQAGEHRYHQNPETVDESDHAELLGQCHPQ